MATYYKYDTAIESLCNKLIDAFGNTDSWKAIIHTDAPATTDTVVGDLTQPTTVNGYTVGGIDITFNSTRGGTQPSTITSTAVDVTWTATTGNLGNLTTLRYVTVYDDTSALDNVFANWDYGSVFTVAVGETFTLDFGASFWTLT